MSAADVVSLRDRLGHDVRTLDRGTDPVSRQALADAAERLSTCSALLDGATSDAQMRTAWLAAVEVLTASRLVRTRAGLDPGPAIPLPPSSAQRLRAATELDVGGRRYVGGPVYTPGQPHWSRRMVRSTKGLPVAGMPAISLKALITVPAPASKAALKGGR